MKFTALILFSLIVSWLLGYYATTMHPEVWRMLITTLFFSWFWWGTAAMAKRLDGLRQRGA